MSDFKTLKKSEKQFADYIWGTFSKEKVALPIRSLNVNSEDELVTFSILNKSDLDVSFFKKVILLLRLDRLGFLVLPIFLILFQCFDLVEEFENLQAIVLCTIGLFFLHYAAVYRNDYKDYVMGIDRIFENPDGKILRLGYMTAKQLRIIAKFCFAIGAILGLQAILLYPEVLVFLAMVGGFAGILYSSKSWGSKNKPLGEFSIFLVYGPLLTVGYQYILVGGYNFEAVFIGVICGLLSLFVIHLRNFEQILAFSQAKLKSSVVLFGFEKTKKFISVWWLLIVASFLFYAWFFEKLFLLLLSVIPFLILTIVFLRKIKKIQSCVGSQLSRLNQAGIKMYYLIIVIWVLATFLNFIDVSAWIETL